MHLIKYHFILPMNIFYCGTDVVLPVYYGHRMADESQGSYSVDQESRDSSEEYMEHEMIRDLLARNDDLRARAERVEAQNHTLQISEQLYQDAAHRAKVELAELRGKLKQRELQLRQLRMEGDAKDAKIYTLEQTIDNAFRRFDAEWMELPFGRESGR